MNWLDDDWRNGLSPRQKEYILALAQAETQIYHRVEYHWFRVHIVEYKGEVFEEPDGRQRVISGQTTGKVISLWTPYWWWLRVKHWRRDRRDGPVPKARLLP